MEKKEVAHMKIQTSLASTPTPNDRKPRKTGLWVALIVIVLLVLALVVCYFTLHIWDERTCTKPAQCRICGTVDGRAAGHDWEDADCTHRQICKDCGKEKGEPLGHNWTNATCQSPSTCALCGQQTGEPLPHNFTEATYNDPGICVDCGTAEGSPKIPSSPLSLLDVISRSKASSVYSGDDLGVHGSNKLYDGKVSTNWTENVPGEGLEESVTFYLDDTYAVKTMRIYIGSHFNRETYEHNCRPKVITLTFSDGTSERITLADSYEEQTITFEKYHYTDSVKLTIKEVYSGTQFDHTIIAEVNFDFYRP